VQAVDIDIFVYVWMGHRVVCTYVLGPFI